MEKISGQAESSETWKRKHKAPKISLREDRNNQIKRFSLFVIYITNTIIRFTNNLKLIFMHLACAVF